MLLFAIIMFLTAALFGVMAVRIYKGKTDLIHDYHQQKVTDKIAYGKAFGKAMALIAGAMAVSGMTAFMRIWIALTALAVGLVAGIAAIICVQKKYNGGVF